MFSVLAFEWHGLQFDSLVSFLRQIGAGLVGECNAVISFQITLKEYTVVHQFGGKVG